MLVAQYGIHRAQADRSFPAIQNRDRATQQRAPCGAESCVHQPERIPPEKARDLSEIMDIGESGMSIQTSSPLEVDRNLDLCLDLSETKTRIGTNGRVVWSNRTGRAGIRFQQPDGSIFAGVAGMAFRECPHRL